MNDRYRVLVIGFWTQGRDREEAAGASLTRKGRDQMGRALPGAQSLGDLEVIVRFTPDGPGTAQVVWQTDQAQDAGHAGTVRLVK